MTSHPTAIRFNLDHFEGAAAAWGCESSHRGTRRRLQTHPRRGRRGLGNSGLADPAAMPACC